MAEVPLDAMEDLDAEPAVDSIGPVEDAILTEVIDSDTDDGPPPWAIPDPTTPADEDEGEDDGGCQSSRPVHSGAMLFCVIALWLSLRRRAVA